MSYYSHCSFFIVTNFEIWVYKGMIIHFLLVTLKVVLDRFFENLNFFLKFRICPRSIFWNLIFFLKFRICPRLIHFTLLTSPLVDNKTWYLSSLAFIWLSLNHWNDKSDSFSSNSNCRASQQTFVGLQDVLKTSSRHVLKTSSTRLQHNNFLSSKTSWKYVFKTSLIRL